MNSPERYAAKSTSVSTSTVGFHADEQNTDEDELFDHEDSDDEVIDDDAPYHHPEPPAGSRMKRHGTSSFAIGSRSQMKRTLTLFGACTFLVGTTIGSGIFASPGLVLLHTHSAGLSLIAWVLATFVAVLGGCTYAELGTAIPESGGEYPYIFRCYGHLPAFLFSWTSNLVLKPGGLAIASIVCAQYALKPFYITSNAPDDLALGVALVILAVAIALNALDVQAAETVLKYLAYLKVLTIGMTAMIGFVYMSHTGPDSGTTQNLAHAFAGSTDSVGEFGVAVIVALWTFDGWNSLNFITEEIINPAHNMPRAILISIPIIALCYMLANISFFAVLVPEQIVDYEANEAQPGFAVVFGSVAMGKFGQVAYSLLIALSAFGALDGGAFVGSRVVYASALRGDFPKTFRTLYGRGEHSLSPLRALIFEGVIAVILLTATNFQFLVNCFCVASWLFYFLAGSCVIVLRYREPKLDRPFRVWIVIPIVFCSIATMLIVATIIQQLIPSMIAIACIVAGIPFYYLEGHVHDFSVRLCCPRLAHIYDDARAYASHHRLAVIEEADEDNHDTEVVEDHAM